MHLSITDKERDILLDALAMYIDVDSPDERAEMEADGQWLSAAESLRDRVAMLEGD